MQTNLISTLIRSWSVWTVLVTGSAMLPTSVVGQSPRDSVRFGVVLDGPWSGNDAVRTLFEREIRDLLGREFDVTFPADKRLVGDWTPSVARAAIDRLLGDADVDFLLAMGPVSSHLVSRFDSLPKPTIAAFVIDAEAQGLPIRNGGSGIPNLSYVSIPNAARRDLETLRRLTGFRRVVYLANPYFLDAAPGLETRIGEIAAELQIGLTTVRAFPPAASVLQALPRDAQAVYLAPLLHFSQADWDALIAGLHERRLPTFSSFGLPEVERGVFATLGTEDFFPRVARRVALNIQRIMLGDEASALPVAFAMGERLTINMATAREIDAYPSWTILVEADLLNEMAPQNERTLSLATAAREAVDANLEVQAENRAVAAGAQEVRLARGNLLPQIDVTATTAFIDRDRADASLGTQPQRTLFGGISATQVLFSEPAWANVAIQRDIQEGRRFNRDATELEIAHEAAVTYLNVLRAKTLRRVYRANLQTTRSNLELARVRNSIGTSGPGEIFRWEAEMANRRIDVLEAQAQQALAETALNRTLHHPLEEPFNTLEPSLTDSTLLTGDPRLLPFADNPRRFQVFRDFWVQEGLALSPELRQIDAGIAAQKRFARSTTNAFWAPTVALQANISQLLSEGGAGTGSPALMLPPGSPDLSGIFPQPNRTNWSFGIQASLPLFQGGTRYAERAQASEELERLQLERGVVAERVEQRIRSALHAIGASYPRITLAGEAANAAERNLELVTDAYANGVVTILELLDAQNAALSAQEASANSVFEFLLDLMDLERAVGRFDFFLTRSEQNELLQRMEAFFLQAGIQLPDR